MVDMRIVEGGQLVGGLAVGTVFSERGINFLY